MPYSSISRTGCASSVPVSDFLQGQQQVRAEGEADNNCCTVGVKKKAPFPFPFRSVLLLKNG